MTDVYDYDNDDSQEDDFYRAVSQQSIKNQESIEAWRRNNELKQWTCEQITFLLNPVAWCFLLPTPPPGKPATPTHYNLSDEKLREHDDVDNVYIMTMTPLYPWVTFM